VLGVGLAQPLRADPDTPTTAPSGPAYISREEYDRRIEQLLQEQAKMRQEI
jgi:hypothetical protein